MASFTITDLPRELTDDEARLMTETCADLFRRFEWLRTTPAHVCKKRHGGKIVEKPDIDPATKKQITLGGVPQFTRTLSADPVCHDCGRSLHRPMDGDGWVCPQVHRHPLRATGPDHAVECGETR